MYYMYRASRLRSEAIKIGCPSASHHYQNNQHNGGLGHGKALANAVMCDSVASQLHNKLSEQVVPATALLRRRAPTAILFGAVDQVRAVVGRDAAVGIAAVEAAVEIKQQRVEMPPL